MQGTMYRSRHNRKIAGVCGGLAEYFGIDATLIRILWAVAFFVFGSGFLLYLIAWILMPEVPN